MGYNKKKKGEKFMNVYAYARVSTKDQNLDRQLEAFTAFKDSLKKIYCDKESGKDFNRLNYQKMIKKNESGRFINYYIY